MKHKRIMKTSTLIIFFFSFSLLGSAQKSYLIDNDSLVNHKNKIINIGYGQQSVWKVTSAISTINGEDITKPFTSNFGNSLRGKLAGLNVINGEGEPSQDLPSLYLRGLSSFSGGVSPLVIIDGVECIYDQLIPEEVESVSLLKDASSTAVYGSRGANGVLLITTKNGNKGPLKVNFKAQYGFESATRLPDFLNAYDYGRLHNEASINEGKETLYTLYDLSLFQSGEDPSFHPNVDWYNKVLRKQAPVSEYNLSLNGGTDDARYFVMLNMVSRAGLLKKTDDLSDFSTNSDYTRYNVRTNLNANLTKKLVADFRLGFTVADKTNPVDYDSQSLFNLISTIPPNAFPVYNPNLTYGGNEMFQNPWGDILETGFYTSNARTFQSLFKLTQDLDIITSGLSASALVAFNNRFVGYSGKKRTYQRFSIVSDANDKPIYTSFGDETPLVQEELTGDKWRNSTFRADMNYNKEFGNNSFDAMLGYFIDVYTIDGNNLPYKHVGMNGRFTYAYDKKYIGEFSFGYTGSNNFMRGKRFGFFPSVSLGWVISEEEFLKDVSFIDFLKIRSSYGLVGNDDVGGKRFMYEFHYYQIPSYYYGSKNEYMWAYSEGRFANPNATWEKEKQLNLGIDGVFFNHLKLGIDVFNKKRYDIIAEPNRTMPQFLGITLPYLNVGEVSNKGFDAYIGYEIRKDDCIFYANFNGGYAKNQIVYNAEIINLYDYQNRIGRIINQPFILEAVGFFKDQEDIDNSPKHMFEPVKPGDLKYKDANNDGVIDQNDYYPIGYTGVPELNFGLTTGFKYKNFDLDVFFQGVVNRTVYLSGRNYQAFQNNGKISSIALNHWTPDTHETATYPRLTTNNNNNFQPSSFWQRNGDFLKLRSLELGYSLNNNFAKKIKLKSIRFFISGSNIFSLDNVKYADPEKLSGYPAMRTVTLGTNIQL